MKTPFTTAAFGDTIVCKRRTIEGVNREEEERFQKSFEGQIAREVLGNFSRPV